jgi:hypothetical protein
MVMSRTATERSCRGRPPSGHVEDGHRERFLAEARRVTPRLVVVDAALRPDHAREEWQTRVVGDGSRFQVYKRYFDPHALLAEVGGGAVLHASDWFVMVASGVLTQTSR